MTAGSGPKPGTVQAGATTGARARRAPVPEAGLPGEAADPSGMLAPVTRGERWPARLAFAAALAAVAVLLLAGLLENSPRSSWVSPGWPSSAGGGLAVPGSPWPGRWLAALVLAAALLAVIVVYIIAGAAAEIALSAGLAVVAVAAGRKALTSGRARAKPRESRRGCSGSPS